MRILFVLFAASRAREIIGFFVRLGVFGPFLLETLDTSFLYLPLANELLLTALITRDRSGLFWLVYVLMGALGSVAGVLLLDLVMRRAGERGLERFVKPRRARWLKSRLAEQAGRALFVASALPPPFPFRPVVMTASALQVRRAKLAASVFCGRLLRFTAEALLILYFGKELLRLMDSEAFGYFVYGLTALAVAGSLLFARKWIGVRRKPA